MQEIKTKYIVASYLLAIIAANFLVHTFGQGALIVTGSLLIPFDFVARDLLHDRWKGSNHVKRIGALVLSGALLTCILNFDAANIALASVVAFALGAIINTVAYDLLYHESRMKRMVKSNALVSVIDSTFFPLIAFCSIDWRLSLLQIFTKVAGATVWAYLINKKGVR